MSEAYRDLIGSNVVALPVKPAKRTSVATSLPEDYEVPAQWKEDGHARRKKFGMPRINMDLEAERFVDSAVAHARKYANWHRAWLNWVTSPWCKGEPQPEPVKASETDDLNRKRAHLMAKGLTGTWATREAAELGLREGILTAEQVRRFGL
jgi:hypothetical protein